MLQNIETVTRYMPLNIISGLPLPLMGLFIFCFYV